MGADSDVDTLGVYVPSPGSELLGKVWEGSGIVGSPAGDTGRLQLHYEGNDEVYPTYVDRVERAAERHTATRPNGARGYPSVASAYVNRDEVIEVGRWDAADGRLEVTDRKKLNSWLE